MLYRIERGLPDGVSVPKVEDLPGDAKAEAKEAVAVIRRLILDPAALEERKREVGVVASMME